MSFQKAIFFSFGLGSALALAGCGGTSSSPGTGGAGGIAPGGGGAGMAGAGGSGAGGTGGGGTSGGGGGATSGCGTDCMHIDYSCYKGMAPVSFKTDILPMFGLSCVTSDCHSPRDHKAGLNLGNKCAYDANAKWKCTFPAAPVDPNDSTKPAPDDPIIMDIYNSVMGVAMTVNGGTVKRVVAGDPGNSFLLLKLADQQNSKGYMCTNADPSHESSPPPCGVAMPQNQELYCQGTYRPRFDAIAAWIAQGAMNN
jgi:hypothetical protein